MVAQALNVQLSITAGDSYDSYFAWITTMLPIGAAVGALTAVFVVVQTFITYQEPRFSLNLEGNGQ